MNTSLEHGQTFQCRVTSEAVKTKISSEVDYGEEIVQSIEPRNKILIQRVFHQPTKGVVEQKLDYIVATSDEEITRHVFGGLFQKKYYPYRPEDYCRKHDPDLDEHIDETMPKLGDKFDTLDTFRLYVDSNAKHWKYYLKCADSHKANGKFQFVYRCVFASSNYNYNPKGLRKRTAKLPKGNCPCRVILKAVPQASNTLTVIYVCNHHDHPVTEEYFEKLQHGRRIHPSVKEEILDFLSLDVDREVVRRHFESMTGYKMPTLYFNNMLQWMKKNNVERQFTLDKLREISRKIEKIKEGMGLTVDKYEEEYIDDDLGSTDKASQIQQAINVLKAVAAPSRPPPKPRLVDPEGRNTGRKRSKILRDESDEDTNEVPVTNKSRLETRLQELTYDHETLQSIKHLQDSVRGEADEWTNQNDFEPWNRSITGHRNKRIRNSQKHMPTLEPKLEPQAVVIENTQNIKTDPESQEIVYENEIVMENPAENCNEIILYQNQNENNGTGILHTENGVNYCIQYQDGTVQFQDGTIQYQDDTVQYQDDTVTEEQSDQQYFLIENLENVPEVRIQATDFATVSIVSQKEDTAAEIQVKTEATDGEVIIKDEIKVKTENDVTQDGCGTISVLQENVKVLGDGAVFDLGPDAVYELIETNDKKIYPTREIVKEMFNKPRKRSATKSNMLEDNSCLTESNDDRSNLDSQQIISDIESFYQVLNDQNLERLGDDEYYMVVVNEDEKSDQSGDDGYDDFKNVLIKEELTNHEQQSCTNDEFLKEHLDDDHEVVHFVNKKVQCDCVSAKDIDRETMTITRLKRIRRSLEKDIKQLVTTKDSLIKDIMKAKKSKRPYAYYD